jgi:hypothetical protein
MNRQEFLDLLDREYTTIRRINEVKGHDYAGDEDALSNFKVQAVETGITPEQVWHVLCNKHWSAVQTFVREGAVQSEPIESRLRDVILYCFLLMGLIEEKRDLIPEDYLSVENKMVSVPAIFLGTKIDKEKEIHDEIIGKNKEDIPF